MRILPFFIGIGDRWKWHKNVKGLDRKIKEIVGSRKSNPDGLLFEVLVALSYAEKGWYVEILEETPPHKSPDLLVSRGGEKYYVECKRQSRQSDYAELERNEFLKRWDLLGDLLIKNNQWLWFRCDVLCDISDVPDDFFVKVISNNLPLIEEEKLIYDGDEASIFVKKIDKNSILDHLKNFKVKNNSPALNSLLGGDLVFPNSQVSISFAGKYSNVIDCEVLPLGSYIEDIYWASGMTRSFKSEVSIEKKSRDVKNLLVDAVKQVPDDTPSIIHIAVETLEGNDVEVRRTQKIMKSIPTFVTEKPVVAVFIHRFQPNNTSECMWDFEETIERFEKIPLAEKIPSAVVLPLNVKPKKGAHWE